MRWLAHGNITRAAMEAMRRHGQMIDTPQTLAEPAAAIASPNDLLMAARTLQREVMTTDGAVVAAIFEQGARFNRCLVYLQLEGGDVEQDDAVDRLFKRYKRLTPGRLYTVTETRVKIRQLPGV